MKHGIHKRVTINLAKSAHYLSQAQKIVTALAPEKKEEKKVTKKKRKVKAKA